MATGTRYTVAYKRRREGKTDYKKRLKLLISKKPRIVVRRSLKNIWIQLVEYDPKGDKILVTAHSRELIKQGWKGSRKNIPAGYLTGLLFGKKAQAQKFKQGIFDLGLLTTNSGSKQYSVLKGIVDSGFEVPHSPEIFPSNERINGKHIQNFKESFEAVKKKILEGKNG